MKNFKFETLTCTAVLLSCVALLSTHVSAQSLLAPVYQGMQPELVQGVQDGLATGKPKLRHVYLAAPDVIAIVVDAQAIPFLPLQKYDKQPGDEIRRSRPQNYGTRGGQFFWGRTIFRNGKPLGDVVGPKEDYYLPAYTLEGEKLDAVWADAVASYAVSTANDASYRTAVTPVAVFRKSKPEVREWVAGGKEVSIQRHEIYLKLPKPLTTGKRYTLAFRQNSPLGESVSFLFDETKLRTEAIHVNLVGYHPRQSQKIARLSQWLGSGGAVDFSKVSGFRLVDNKTRKTVFQGKLKLRAAATPNAKIPPEGTAGPEDVLPMPLYDLDFSSFAKNGVYRIVVPGVGTSFPFRIDENVWQDVTKVSAQGYLNQRSGIALGPPYTNYRRPRNFHPADGVPIYKTDPEIYYDVKRFPKTKGVGNAFDRIQASLLEDQTEPNAWGGWHDAADFDRSILPQNHPRAVHAMLDIVQSNPAYFEKLNLNIPESKNKIPDLVDEALWCMELFRRIQQPDGGGPSAVESIEHPSEPSFLLKQPTATTPPTPQTCHVYAAAAAQMALVLQKYDAELSKTYREGAERAMKWAADNPQVPNIYTRNFLPEEQHANLAAFWMYRLTGEDKWHQEFKRTLRVAYPNKIKLDSSSYNGPWGFLEYSLLPEGQGDAALKEECRNALLEAANKKTADINRWSYNLAAQRFNWDERLGQPWEVIMAHRLTGDAKYRLALEQQVQFSLGANPLNASFTTGLGARQVVPFSLDARWMSVEYATGITTFGPVPRNAWGAKKLEDKIAPDLTPAWENWPTVESYFNIRHFLVSEYVVGGNMANVLMSRAYLAQLYARENKTN